MMDIKKILAEAERGFDYAQFDLGCMYLDGDGVPQDLVEAVKWFRKSAEQGYSRAQSSLGAMYEIGQGVPQDFAEAIKWYSKAADRGNAVAQNNLGVILADGKVLPKDYLKAAELFRQSTNQENVEALRNLGRLYRNGQGVARDSAEAANHEDAIAQLYIGCRYSLVQKHAEAVIWFDRAAEQGNVNAQLCLGAMYYEGILFAQDFDEAFKWLIKASKQQDLEAQWQFILGHIFYFKKSAEAVDWFRRAAEQGDVKAQLCLGAINYEGKFMLRDFDEAFKWLSKATVYGHVDAARNWRSICDARLILFDSKRQASQSMPMDSITWRISDILKRNLRRKSAPKDYTRSITYRFIQNILKSNSI